MRVGGWLVVIAICLNAVVVRSAAQANANISELEGVWLAESMEVNGKTAPRETIVQMRFTFNGTTLAVRGNSIANPDYEETCPFTVAPTKSPKQLDFTDPNGNAIRGIYDLKSDVLTVCLRRGPGERPPGK